MLHTLLVTLPLTAVGHWPPWYHAPGRIRSHFVHDDLTLRPQRAGAELAVVPVMTDEPTWPGVTIVDRSTLCVSVRAPSGVVVLGGEVRVLLG
jgi:hypothetical protein